MAELDRGAGRTPELPLGRRAHASNCRSRRVVVAGQPVEPDQQGLVVLVQRTHHRRADGQVAAPVELAAREEAQRGLVEDRLRGRGQAAPLREQPRLERRGVRRSSSPSSSRHRGRPGRRPRASARGRGRRRPPRVPAGSTSSHRVAVQHRRRGRARAGSRPGTTAGRATGPRPPRTAARPAGLASVVARRAAGRRAGPSSSGSGSGTRGAVDLERGRPTAGSTGRPAVLGLAAHARSDVVARAAAQARSSAGPLPAGRPDSVCQGSRSRLAHPAAGRGGPGRARRTAGSRELRRGAAMAPLALAPGLPRRACAGPGGSGRPRRAPERGLAQLDRASVRSPSHVPSVTV